MSIRPAWLQLFLDTPVADVERAVTFWSAVTGWAPSERRGEDGQFLTLVPRQGSAYVKVQAVEGPAGIHLDLDSTDRPAMVERAAELGATHAWTYQDVEVMRSPGGLAFCLTVVDGEPVLVRDGSTVLDQVCIDIPSAHWDTEVAFWAGLTGRGSCSSVSTRSTAPCGPTRTSPRPTGRPTRPRTSPSARGWCPCTTSGRSSSLPAGRSTA